MQVNVKEIYRERKKVKEPVLLNSRATLLGRTRNQRNKSLKLQSLASASFSPEVDKDMRQSFYIAQFIT